VAAATSNRRFRTSRPWPGDRAAFRSNSIYFAGPQGSRTTSRRLALSSAPTSTALVVDVETKNSNHPARTRSPAPANPGRALRPCSRELNEEAEGIDVGPSPAEVADIAAFLHADRRSGPHGPFIQLPQGARASTPWVSSWGRSEADLPRHSQLRFEVDRRGSRSSSPDLGLALKGQPARI